MIINHWVYRYTIFRHTQIMIFFPMLVGSWPQQKRCKGNSVWGDTSHFAPAAPRPLSSRAPRFAQQWLLPMGCSKRPGIYQPIKSGSLTKTRSSLICDDMCIWLYVYADTESSWNGPRWFQMIFQGELRHDGMTAWRHDGQGMHPWFPASSPHIPDIPYIYIIPGIVWFNPLKYLASIFLLVIYPQAYPLILACSTHGSHMFQILVIHMYIYIYICVQIYIYIYIICHHISQI